MQNFIVVGRTTQNVELKYTQGGIAIASFSVACDRYNAKKLKEEGKQSADFFNCISFGKQAEYIANHLKKGKLVEIYGEVNIDVVDKDGCKQYYTKVKCNSINILEYENKEQQKYDNNNDFASIDEESDCPF